MLRLEMVSGPVSNLIQDQDQDQDDSRPNGPLEAKNTELEALVEQNHVAQQDLIAMQAQVFVGEAKP